MICRRVVRNTMQLIRKLFQYIYGIAKLTAYRLWEGPRTHRIACISREVSGRYSCFTARPRYFVPSCVTPCCSFKQPVPDVLKGQVGCRESRCASGLGLQRCWELAGKVPGREAG